MTVRTRGGGHCDVAGWRGGVGGGDAEEGGHMTHEAMTAAADMLQRGGRETMMAAEILRMGGEKAWGERDFLKIIIFF